MTRDIYEGIYEVFSYKSRNGKINFEFLASPIWKGRILFIKDKYPVAKYDYIYVYKHGFEDDCIKVYVYQIMEISPRVYGYYKLVLQYLGGA